MDVELRAAQRSYELAKARSGQPDVIRPMCDYELPSDPWDGETLTFAYARPVETKGKINATGGWRISLSGGSGSVTSTPDGIARPLPCGDATCAVRLMALLQEKTWLSTLVSGLWQVE